MDKSLNDKVLNIVKLAITTGIESSNDQFTVQQIQYMGKTADCLIIFPYGYHARLPIDQLLAVLSIGAEEENRVALGSGTGSDRPDIEQGEVTLYHPTAGSKIVMKNSGDIDVIPGGSGIVNLGDGGDKIARLGDTVQVSVIGVTAGAATITANGTITGSGENKST